MATKQIAWQTGSGNITLTYQGQGDGTISVQSDVNEGSARSQVITVETVGGAITKNFTVNQAACPFPVGDIKNFSYTGSYQEIELPAGQYKLQCWGAQGGSNAAASSYDITAKAGGKGGYSEGIITLSQKTTVRIYVGGQGSSSAGGFNGGGSTTGSSTYNASDEQGVSRMGGGGGATDIRLSDGALLSRMIVAGGGAGGAMCYQKVTTSTTSWKVVGTFNTTHFWQNGSVLNYLFDSINSSIIIKNQTYRATISNIPNATNLNYKHSDNTYTNVSISSGSCTWTASKDMNSGSLLSIQSSNLSPNSSNSLILEVQETTSSTTTDSASQIGFVGGGVTGGGYSSTYQGKQNAAGSGGAFGQGANQAVSNSRYCSGAGGGGWYGGGGGQTSNSSMTYCKYSGGGSGFVNTAASAGNRPSSYTGLELDSGSTVDGEQTFEAPAGGTETGHSGNGYARITRLAETSQWDFEYTGEKKTQAFEAGTYKIECWGAQGGSYNSSYPGGKGGYSVGELTLTARTTVYVCVGGQGTGGTTSGDKAGGFNGGGRGYSTSTTYVYSGGGGASDVRIGQDSLYARVIVAGGGGGSGSYSSSYKYAGGYGGGISGGTPSQYSTSYKAGTGGSQTARGNSYYGSTANSTTYGDLAGFGNGGGAKNTSYRIAGGGGGWYGGGYSQRGAAGGGSGYVYNANTASNYPSGCLLNSNYYLADSETKGGDTSFPNTAGTGNETGHSGNGYVRITKLN